MRTPAQKRSLAKYRASSWYKNRFLRMKKNPEKYAEYVRKRRQYQNLWNLKSKIRVLTYYGKKGKLCCSWRGCDVSDLDCLTLDHIKNDGAKHRASGYSGGMNGYTALHAAGLPTGFQTLCANHQLKKENQRRRKEKKINGIALRLRIKKSC
jgi:hypothetical protein